MKEKIRNIIFIPLICVLSSCSNSNSLVKSTSYFPVKDSTTRRFINDYPDYQNNSFYIFGKIIKTLNSEGYGNLSNSKVNKLITGLTYSTSKLVKIDSKSLKLNYDFLKYMPTSYPKIQEPELYNLNVGEYQHPTYYIDDWDNTFGEHRQFKYKSKYFPNTFVYPKDLINHYIYKFHGQDYGRSKASPVNYLILRLPKSLRLYFKLSPLGIYPKKYINRRYGGDGYGWILIKPYTKAKGIFLNPSFTETYDDNINRLWSLYLFNIKYDILKDTSICYGLRNAAFHPNNGCPLNLLSQNVKTYLEGTIEKDREMYKSYFELIFWQMYQPKNFKIKDNKGAKRSFTFTSTSERFPGNYKVKFNIYRPYEFKVKRR